MTIQISVTIWTVICFIVLMLVLNNLLFKPVLKCMDQRRSKIAAAKAKKAEYDSIIREQELTFARKKEEHEAQQRRLIKERVETIRHDQRKAIEAAKEVRLHQLDDYRQKTDAEEKEILSSLSGHAGELAVMFADSIVKG